MNINWTNISQADFLKDYWQKQPVVLKSALVDFEDPIDANELAGLAMEEVVESRIVSNESDKWSVKHGPFADFDDLPENGWSLLVQGVDRWVPDVFAMRSVVDFLPKWRVDDVMVSYSAKNGGVGAHLDQYDVFIVQGSGKRRWQVAPVDRSLKQEEVSQDLLQVTSFSPSIDVVLEPGDILYIPPFSAHCGETLEPSLSFSLGFRTPSQSELLTSFADYIFENEFGKKRFEETLPADGITNANTSIPQSTIDNLKTFMLESLNNDQFEKFSHQFLTEPTRELDIVPSEQEWTEELLLQLCLTGAITINKVLALQTSSFINDEGLHFYCNGTYFKLLENQKSFIQQLEQSQTLDKFQLKSSLTQLENITLLTTLINTGYWYIDEV